ncbi:pentapeptide repeat-containing protein [Scytonema sp. UIC 10036]|uniref:pentapeptide repeat-containing protein n=1 Tax=Scytonema sp. UIC 10036 TaxID=2304196 RepID=UPI001FAAB966|nr:pentapeptide repeat-containing protein [Scytonema sp. UIC 10036]
MPSRLLPLRAMAKLTSFQTKPLLTTIDITVEELLRRYIAGERSFERVNLCEVDLHNAHLHGVNLNQADLRQTRTASSA